MKTSKTTLALYFLCAIGVVALVARFFSTPPTTVDRTAAVPGALATVQQPVRLLEQAVRELRLAMNDFGQRLREGFARLTTGQRIQLALAALTTVDAILQEVDILVEIHAFQTTLHNLTTDLFHYNLPKNLNGLLRWLLLKL